MNPGKQFQEEVDGNVYSVVYTKHFVERYELDEPGRPAARKMIDEPTIALKIREALPAIDEIADYDTPFSGVIQSRSKKLNMSFSVSETANGFQLTMMNMMQKIGYTPKSVKDYVVQVNPGFVIRFSRGIAKPLQESVLDELIPQLSSLEDETSYHLRGADVEYWVEVAGKNVYVDDADWVRDMYEIQVA